MLLALPKAVGFRVSDLGCGVGFQGFGFGVCRVSGINLGSKPQ